MSKALFLDRDGVINIEKDYLYKIDDFEFIEGIIELTKYFQNLDYKIVVVTNQSGIARGYYSEDDFKSLTFWMKKEFLKYGVELLEVYHCPHHPDISGECVCRKPKPGMLLQAAQEYGIDLKNSIIVGDKERDIEAGINAGLTETFLFDESSKVKSSQAKYIINNLNQIWKNRC